MGFDIQTLPRQLSKLYSKNGYEPYTMSKFEEYALYLRNKDFLVSDRVLTFTDTDGKLMALKPDVTLSIIKNTRPSTGAIRKLFYQENVYRPGKSGQGFREIMQIGLECMGQVDAYCIFEVLRLAILSLRTISNACVLDISHMGLLSRALDEAGLSGKLRKMALAAISSKNLHELRELCSSKTLETMAVLCGKPAQVLPQLQALFPDAPELAELKILIAALESAGCADCINIDFSVVNDMQYYNGIVFRGFVEGVPEGVLSGGEYDGLMERMNRKEKAIGFALYPDLLERLMPPSKEEAPKALLLYSTDSPLEAVAQAVQKLAQQEIAVNAQPDTGNVSAAGCRVYRLEGKEVRYLGNDA